MTERKRDALAKEVHRKHGDSIRKLGQKHKIRDMSVTSAHKFEQKRKLRFFSEIFFGNNRG